MSVLKAFIAFFIVAGLMAGTTIREDGLELQKSDDNLDELLSNQANTTFVKWPNHPVISKVADQTTKLIFLSIVEVTRWAMHYSYENEISFNPEVALRWIIALLFISILFRKEMLFLMAMILYALYWGIGRIRRHKQR